MNPNSKCSIRGGRGEGLWGRGKEILETTEGGGFSQEKKTGLNKEEKKIKNSLRFGPTSVGFRVFAFFLALLLKKNKVRKRGEKQ